ncbi:MAG: SpoIIIAH-like family protein [Bacillota bacterium]|nr:SpoIIIAH-like family protein [Bacillota bacterium]
MKHLKRNITIVTVLIFVCTAVYLNWSYNNSWGKADDAMVKAEDDAMMKAEEAYAAKKGSGKAASDYFAEARLNRQVSRDEALELLETAAASDAASQDTIDSAMSAISAMANYSMQETQLENLLIAKDFSDCVVYMTDDSITVAVPAPAEGLSAAAVARITETITAETNYAASQLNVIEVSA